MKTNFVFVNKATGPSFPSGCPDPLLEESQVVTSKL